MSNGLSKNIGDIKTHVQLELDHFQDPALRNRRQEGSTRHNGPTLLSAIDAAIRSIK